MVKRIARAEGEAGGDERVFEVGAFGDAQASVVQVGTTALGGGEEVIAGGVVHHGLFNLAFDGQRNAHAVHGQAVDEVHGAVQGVDDPHVFRILGPMLFARLFGPDAVAGVGCQQGFDDGLLSGLVDFGHKIVGGFLRYADRFNVERSTVDDGTGSAGGLDGHIDHRVKIWGHEDLN